MLTGLLRGISRESINAAYLFTYGFFYNDDSTYDKIRKICNSIDITFHIHEKGLLLGRSGSCISIKNDKDIVIFEEAMNELIWLNTMGLHEAYNIKIARP